MGPHRCLIFFPLKITGPFNYSLIVAVSGGNRKETAKELHLQKSENRSLISKSTIPNKELTQNSEGCSGRGRKYKFLIPVKVELGTNPKIPLD